MFKYYKVQDGFYKKCNYIHCLFIVLITALILSVSVNIFGAIQSNKTRRYIDTAREQLATAEETNRELRTTIDGCRFIVGELATTTDRNIEDIRGCISLIEEIRIEVGSLEMELGMWDSDSIYSWYDNRVELPEEMR